MSKKYAIVALGALITANINSTHYVRRAAAPLGTAAAMCAATYWGDKQVACKESNFNRSVGSPAAWREHKGLDIKIAQTKSNEFLDNNTYRPAGKKADIALDQAGFKYDGLEFDYGSMLRGAAKRGNKEGVVSVLKSGINVDTASKKGKTALMVSASKGHKDIVKLLLKAGAKINTTDNDGVTALMIAAREGYKDVVKILLDARADVGVISRGGSAEFGTALAGATLCGRGDVASLLIWAGADVAGAIDLDEAQYHKCAWYRPWEKDKKGKTHAELLELLLAGKTVCQSN